MKVILTSLICLLISVSVFAKTTVSCGFSVSSANGKKFTLIANGVKQNAVPAGKVTVLNSASDVVKIKIDWADKAIPDLEKTLYLRLGELEHYQLKQKSDTHYRLAFDRSEELPEPVHPSARYQTGLAYQSAGRNNGCSPSPAPLGDRCAVPESRYAVYSIAELIRSESFESDKLKRAKEAVMNSCLASEQIAQLLPAFTYESTRLKFAKFAYPYALNKGSYMAVARGFEYMGSKEELEKFIWAQSPNQGR